MPTVVSRSTRAANQPLERAGMSARADVAAGSAGRSAPGRYPY